MAESKRDRYLLQANAMKAERDNNEWVAHWRELSDWIQPRRSRFLTTDVNKGGKRNQKIIDSTATMANRTLQAGMMSGASSPARPWFNLSFADPDLAKWAPVKRWLHSITETMRSVMLESNFYNELGNTYGDCGCFGTSALMIQEDSEDVIRAFTFPIGSFALSQNERNAIDCFFREFSMTVRQMVGMFGLKNCSKGVQDQYNRGVYEQRHTVCHLIRPNDDYKMGNLLAKHKRVSSCYFENGQGSEYGDVFLRESGYDLFPVCAPRWATNGEDLYGSSPGMDALGDVKALQLYEKRTAQAVEKMLNPPIVGPASMKKEPISMLPGSFTAVDEREGQKGLRAMHEINFNIKDAEFKAEGCRQRIRRAFYEDLFLMMAQDQRSGTTAREVQERHEEKLLAVGPVMNRLTDDLYQPSIDIIFSIMVKTGLVPPAPTEIQGMPLKVEFTSIMAQAQKMVGLASLERFLNFGLTASKVYPEVLDKINIDKAADEYGDITSINPEILRSDDEVAKIRGARQAQIQQQQKLANAEMASKTAKNLAGAPTDGNTALSGILNQQYQNQTVGVQP